MGWLAFTGRQSLLEFQPYAGGPRQKHHNNLCASWVIRRDNEHNLPSEILPTKWAGPTYALRILNNEIIINIKGTQGNRIPDPGDS